MIKFTVNQDKALEAIVYLANKKPNIDHYHVVKTLFYADKNHLNKYGRPILGDVYIKMKAGPVPSFIYDIINKNSFMLDDAIYEKINNALEITQKYKMKAILSKRDADITEFSESDIECIDEAFTHCDPKSFDELFNETHKEAAWINANLNDYMDYSLLLDDNNPSRCDIIDDLKENSASMVF